MLKNCKSSTFRERCVICDNITMVHLSRMRYFEFARTSAFSDTDRCVNYVISSYLGRSRITCCGDNDKLTQVLTSQFLSTVI